MITAIPAIDLIGGHIVRLAKGDFSKITQYGSTPAEIAKEFDALGFKRLHVVDLDAAGRKGRDNIATLREITSATSMKVDFGGGLRSDEAIERAFDAGAIAVSIGSVAIKEPEKAKRWISKYGTERFILSADVLDGEVRKLDVIDCNGRRAVNICSVGIDARIGTDVGKYKRIPLMTGSGAYALSTLVNVIKGIHRHYIVEIAGERIDARQTMICVCNGRWYGGGFNPVPDAELDDGLLDVLLVAPVSRLQVASIIGKYKKGQYRDYPDLIRHFRVPELRVICDSESRVNIDGELLLARDVRFSVARHKIRFFYPKGLSWEAKSTIPGAK